MNNNELFNSFEKAVFLSKSNRIQKIAKPRILFSLILKYIALSSKKSFKVKAKTFWGEDMVVIIPEQVSLYLYRYGFFEEGLTKMVLGHLKPGMTFFDIGSHFGYYTLLASYIAREGNVHAFEPTPSTFNILSLNVFNRPNVILNNFAVASKIKKVLINDYGVRYSAFNSVCNTRLPKNIIAKLNPKQHEMQAILIDEYVEKNKVKPDFIKIDAESYEYEILLGMKQTIEKYHSIITIEVGDYDTEGVPTSRELVEFLMNRGYQPYEYSEGKILPHVPKNKYSYGNLLFLQNE